MPLRCLGPDDRSIQSFDLTDEEWSALRSDNGRLRHLRMPCCEAPLVMKTSSRGLNFFAHKPGGPCQSKPETEEHLVLKAIAAEGARRAGWACSTEATGSSPSDETWTADVLAQKGHLKVAIEIQWSSQTSQETLRRQERYHQSGVRCLWLFRQPGFPTSKELPGAHVSGDITTGFEARLPNQAMPLNKFLDAVFGRRFRYGIPVGARGAIRILSGVLECWKCREQTRIITFIEVLVGPHRCQFRVPELNDFPDLLTSCQERIPTASRVGILKSRFSRALKQSYMSNGCYFCDALVGQFFERDAWYVESSILAEFETTISERWLEALQSDGDNYGWAVFTFE